MCKMVSINLVQRFLISENKTDNFINKIIPKQINKFIIIQFIGDGLAEEMIPAAS
jgi:hypothetical protein